MSRFITRAAGIVLIGATALAQSPAPPAERGSHVILGRVVDVDSGRPIPHAVVTLIGFVDPFVEPVDRALPDRQHAIATTDGRFVFRGLPSGPYSLMSRASGHVENDYPPYKVEFAETDGPAEVTLRLAKFGAIGGRVVDERGDPVAGLDVIALRRIGTGAEDGFSRTTVSARTDDRGIYRLAQLAPGKYVVAVASSTRSIPAPLAAALSAGASNPRGLTELRRRLSRGGASFGIGSGDGSYLGDVVLQHLGGPQEALVAPDGRPLAYANTYHPQARTPDEASVIEIASGEARDGIDLTIRLRPAVRVSGLAIGPDGPLENLSIHLVSPGLDRPIFEVIGSTSAVTDSRGEFTFVAVAPGEYRLQATLIDGDERTGEGLSLWADDAIVVGDTDVSSVSVRVRPGIRVSGRMVFEGQSDSALPAGARMTVVLQPVGADSWRTLPAVVRADGTFSSAGDAPGRYLVNAFAAPPWQVLATSIEGRATGEAPIVLVDRDVSSLTITMTQAGTRLGGRVTNAAGEPETNVSVIVLPADVEAWRDVLRLSRRSRHVRTTTTGTFDIRGLTPGDYHVVATPALAAGDWRDDERLSALRTRSTRVTLGDGQSVDVKLTTTGRER